MSPPPSIAIIGAGITGLTLATALRKTGAPVRILEQADRPGGVIATSEQDGCLLETGPSSLQLKSAAVEAFLHENGLQAHIRPANEAANKRYLVKDGRPVALPMGLLEAIRTPLYTIPQKLRVLREPFIGRPPAGREESLEAFVCRRLGRPFYTYGVSVLASGIYAGDPTRLSVQHAFPKVWNLEHRFGSLIRGTLGLRRERRRTGETPYRPRLLSFAGGLETLPRTLAAPLGEHINLSARITRIHRDRENWRVAWVDTTGEHTQTFAQIVLTIPIHHWAELPFDENTQTTLRNLPDVKYAPLSIVTLTYDRAAVGHPLDGFGMLIPLEERRKILGAIFGSTLFPENAPADRAAFNVFVGGMTRPDLAALGADAAIDLAHGDLADLLGITTPPRTAAHYPWPRAIPQYNVGYGRFLHALDQTEAQIPGLHFAGNFRGGPGLSDCMANALTLVGRLIGGRGPGVVRGTPGSRIAKERRPFGA
ncbi:MAG: protoporphyrinogen oxidase [Opitutales bacterium]|nr:protoporphyrinogen oxidase [Opitutales bacterium]